VETICIRKKQGIFGASSTVYHRNHTCGFSRGRSGRSSRLLARWSELC
jgi:hypothetical protein